MKEDFLTSKPEFWLFSKLRKNMVRAKTDLVSQSSQQEKDDSGSLEVETTDPWMDRRVPQTTTEFFKSFAPKYQDNDQGN